jgi:Flp pilus assembly protein TadD
LQGRRRDSPWNAGGLGGRDQLVLFVFALGTRLLHILAIQDSAYFGHPIVDAQTYHEAAQAIAAGAGHPDKVFWQPPGYPYFLGLIYALAGPGLVLPRIAQAVLGAIAAVLTARIGAVAFGRGVGLAAGIAAACYGTLFFFDGELLPVSLTIALQLTAVALAQRAQLEARRRWWGLAGLVMGLASLVTATSLVLSAVIAGFARRRALYVVAGTALAIAPATLHNWVRGGEPVLISFNGGINLFLGNNPDYDRTVAIRPDREWKKLTSEPARAGVVRYDAQSSYFVGKVRDYLVDDPAGFTRLQLKKARLLLGGDEILRNHSIYAFRSDSPILAATLWKLGFLAFPWGLLIPLGVVGLVFRGRRAPLLATVVLVYALVVIAFFITARSLIDAGIRQRIGAGMVALAVFALANFGQGPMDAEMNPDAKYSLAVQLADEGEKREAARLYGEALAVKPDYAEAWLNLGTILMEWNQATEAESAFSRAAAIDPEDADALVNLGNILAARDDLGEALELYRRAFLLKPRHELAMENLETLARQQAGLGGEFEIGIWILLYEQNPSDPRYLGNVLTLLERQGEHERAIPLLRNAVINSPDDPALRFTLGRLLVLTGKSDEGLEALRGALKTGDPRVRQWIESNPNLRAVASQLR